MDCENCVVSVVRELVVGMENRWNGPNRRRSKYVKKKTYWVSLRSQQIPWNSLKCNSCLSCERSETNTLIPQYYEIRLRAVRLCVHVALEWSSDWVLLL